MELSLSFGDSTTSRVTIEKKVPSYFLTTSYQLPSDFPFSWEEKLVAPLIATPNGEVRK
jgi:hypothetical protein